jgi:curli production assembly/transport component CsgF
MGKRAFGIAAIIGLVGLVTPSLATEQVYHPINPVLGGNPNNGPALLSAAQSQGEGAKSGNQGPDLSGLDKALAGLGTGGQTGNGSTPPPNPAPPLQNSIVANPLATPAKQF